MMETNQIISWLRDKADRADNPSWTRMMHMAAKRLEELDADNFALEQWLLVMGELYKSQKEVNHESETETES